MLMPVKVDHFVALEFSSINLFFFLFICSPLLLSLVFLSEKKQTRKNTVRKEPIGLFSSVLA